MTIDFPPLIPSCQVLKSFVDLNGLPIDPGEQMTSILPSRPVPPAVVPHIIVSIVHE